MAANRSEPKTIPSQRAAIRPFRTYARAAGIFYLLTFVSIPTLALYGPVKELGYITGPGPDAPAFLGGALELVVGLACIGTAVALYPVLRRQNEGIALGFVSSRILEAATIFTGVAALWTLVALRQDGLGADAVLLGQAVVAFYDHIFLVGQGFIPSVNALLLGSLLFHSRLVPRVLPVLGFIGAVTLVSYNTSELLGFSDETPAVVALVAVLPIATWEFSLGVYLVVKGFRPQALAALVTRPEPLARPQDF